jgi:hypothetical protein
MRYRVGQLTIRTENAAKVPREASRKLAKWLLANVRASRALDYGCGRLRYTPQLARVSKAIGLVDSEDQLDRRTRIGRTITSVRARAMHLWPACRVYSIQQFWNGTRERYDFALCANVLSAIPSLRLLTRSVLALHSSLTREGVVLFVNQHSNSYFTKTRTSPNAIPHLHGWVLNSRKGPAYFGILPKDRVISLVTSRGFRVHDAWIEGQSNYVLARKRP